MMPNQNQWSVFKRLLTYLKPYKFLTFLALAFLLSTTVIKSIIPLVASYFIDHYLHDMNQAASLILIGYYGLYLLVKGLNNANPFDTLWQFGIYIWK